jgi:multidrug efflux pump subunit AcrB
METSRQTMGLQHGGGDLPGRSQQSELESALLASTTTNLVAVVPFLLIGGFISLIFNELILTVSFAIAASLVVALTVVPTLASRLMMGAARDRSRGGSLSLVQYSPRRG